MTSALIVGAGGLGGPIARALAGEGVALTIYDGDAVELSNLPRQTQFSDHDLGAPKAQRLAARVGGRGVAARWPTAIDDDCDIVIDASDDPATKFAVNDWAVARARCYVIAAAVRYGGNVFAGAPGSPCYRCLFEDPDRDAASCGDAGILAPVVGAIGGLAAAVALALLAGDRSCAGRIYAFDDLRRTTTPRIVEFRRRPTCPTCMETN